MDPSAEMTIGSTRLTSCQLTTKWRGSCFFPLAAAESWGLMPVGADGPGLPTSGKGCSVLIGQAWVTCLPTVTPSVKMRSVHRVHQKKGVRCWAGTNSRPSHRKPRYSVSSSPEGHLLPSCFEVDKWLSPPNGLFSSKQLALSLGLGAY